MDLRDLVAAFLSAATTDIASVRPLLADAMTWDLNGERQTASADDFISRQAADLSTGTASTEVDEIVVAGNEAVVIGWAVFVPKDGGPPLRARLVESFTFRDRTLIKLRDVMPLH